MLSKSHRLTKKQFNDVYEKKVFFTPFFAYRFLCDSTIKNTGFSVVVPKSVYKKAHDRNILKRLYFNLLKDNKDMIKNGNYNCIIMISKKSIDIKKEEINVFLLKMIETLNKECQK